MFKQKDLRSSSPLYWEKSSFPPIPHQTFLLPSLNSTSLTELATAPEETAQTTGSLEDYKTLILYTEKSVLHPGPHPTVAHAFEPSPTTNFSAEVVNREKGQRSKCTLSIYRGGSEHTKCFCSWPTSVFLSQQPTCY